MTPPRIPVSVFPAHSTEVYMTFLFKVTPDSRDKFANCITLLEEHGVDYFTQKQGNCIIFEWPSSFVPDFVTDMFGDESCKLVGKDPLKVEKEVVQILDRDSQDFCGNLGLALQGKGSWVSEPT